MKFFSFINQHKIKAKNNCPTFNFTSALKKLKNKGEDLFAMHSNVEKHITKGKPQSYFDHLIVDKYFDKKRYDEERSGKLGPTKPLYPNENERNVYNTDEKKINEYNEMINERKTVTFNDYFDFYEKKDFNRLRENIHLASEINNKHSFQLYDLSKLRESADSLKKESDESQNGVFVNAIEDIYQEYIQENREEIQEQRGITEEKGKFILIFIT